MAETKKKKRYGPCKCGICKQPIDRNVEIEGVDWINPSNLRYFHKKCYEDWKQSSPATDEEYIEYIYDFLSRDLKVKYDYFKCKAQIEKFSKNKMTIKGQFFTLKYFYEVKHGDWNKGYGGIGIIPYVYQEACTYWVNKSKENEGIIERIEQQMRESKERQKRVVRKKEKKEKKVVIDLKAIGEMESDE